MAVEVTAMSLPLTMPPGPSSTTSHTQAPCKCWEHNVKDKDLCLLGAYHLIEEGLSHDLGCSTPGDIMFFVNGALHPTPKTGGLGKTEINRQGHKITGSHNQEASGYSNCGPRANSIDLAWVLLSNADSQAPSPICQLRVCISVSPQVIFMHNRI